jgi:transcription-repair coupling factor (superfamily II helicase)
VNLSGLLAALRGTPAYGELLLHVQAGRAPAEPLALLHAARPFLVAALASDTQRPLILVTARSERAQQWAEQLPVWLGDARRVYLFADPDALPYERIPWSRDTRQQRLKALAALAMPPAASAHRPPAMGDDAVTSSLPLVPPIVVAGARALMQKTLPPRELRLSVRPLQRGQLIDLQRLLARWLGLGYVPVSIVEEPGTFNRRGGIVDIFPPNLDWPVRLELFGDQLDSLRTFDPASQRTRAHVEQAIVGPATETLTKYGEAAAERLAELDLGSCHTLTRQRIEEEQQQLAQGTGFRGVEFYLPYMYSQPGMLLDYLPSDGLLIVEDGAELTAAWAGLEEQSSRLQQDLAAARELPAGFLSPILDWQAAMQRFEARSVAGSLLTLGMGRLDGRPAATQSPVAGTFAPALRYGGRLRQVLDEALAHQAAGQRSVWLTRQAPRLATLLSEAGQETQVYDRVDELPPAGRPVVVQGNLPEGWVLRSSPPADIAAVDASPVVELALLTDTELFGWSTPYHRRRPRPRPMAPEAFFAEVNAGDFVVHMEHGIGLFQGLTTIDLGGAPREYLQVDYAQGDKLYVPVHQADRLSRYVGASDVPPVLHRLGTADWALVKRRAKQAVADLAEELLELYAAREVVYGHAFAPDSPWQAELESSFPYVETEDQLDAVAEVKADMERPQPMDRLICGDVGYGKTEVALRAAFKAVMDGKQVALLVPTTVLAQQHHQTFIERLRAFPVEVEMLSRFRSPKQQHETLARLQAGSADIVVGTHRLLSKDVTFKDLGLLIVDEEQRFGVGHKEKIKRLRQEVDVLTLTATPIPRTLYMSLSGARDMSTINTPPEERLPIRTTLAEYDETLIRQAILRELDRGGQVYFVFNRVRGIQQMTERLRRLVPEATFAVGHGQMQERQLADVMADFAAGQTDVLVCTTIIQSGLDIPNANTLIIHRADRFGLADLYQLRGRVGRGAARAYAYLLMDKHQTLSPVARQRLETILEASELGAGFQIALRDLEIRGAGELLGARQHGHIAAVGFDLYTRLLAQSVSELRQRKQDKAETPASGPLPAVDPLAPPVALELPVDARIPEEYVADTSLRLQLYRRLAGLADLHALNEMERELADRFGPLPQETRDLLYVVRVKALCQRAGVSSIAQDDDQLTLLVDALASLDRAALQQQLGPDARVGSRQIWLAIANRPDWQELLAKALQTLAQPA